ncbi:MAG: alpha/beta hydrolase [Methanobrevibacter sp.]|nr:alpha/beta hydrolase [Methanobrevibacter sp.]
MNYKVEGTGKPVVFIHGLSDNLLFWEFLASNLKNYYQVIRMDLRGHGDTELGNDVITIGLLADDLKNLLNEMGIENDVDIIGFSLGGAVALDFAIRYPRMVSSLVLMSSFCRADEYLSNILNQFKEALNNSFEEFYDLILPMVLCPQVIKDNSEELEVLKALASKTANTQAYIQSADACLNFNVEKDLSQINVPTLILSGKWDSISLLTSQKNLKNKIKNSKLIVFDNVKHNLLVGRNNAVILDILKDFLKII